VPSFQREAGAKGANQAFLSHWGQRDDRPRKREGAGGLKRNRILRGAVPADLGKWPGEVAIKAWGGTGGRNVEASLNGRGKEENSISGSSGRTRKIKRCLKVSGNLIGHLTSDDSQRGEEGGGES